MLFRSARGVRGGGDGARAHQVRIDRDGQAHEVTTCGVVTLQDGERMLTHTTGGGGYGPALEREPDQVARDVREGWISRDKAASTYQVVVDGAGRLDAAATASLRGERVSAAAGGD